MEKCSPNQSMQNIRHALVSGVSECGRTSNLNEMHAKSFIFQRETALADGVSD